MNLELNTFKILVAVIAIMGLLIFSIFLKKMNDIDNGENC